MAVTKEFLFEMAEKASALAEQIIERSQKVDIELDPADLDSLFKGNGARLVIAKMFLYGGNDDFKAFLLLVREELYNSAFIIVRRLFELAVDLCFIDKAPEERTRQFLMFESIQQEMRIRLLEKHFPDSAKHADEQARESKRANFRIAMRALGYKICEKPPSKWSKYNLKERCEEIGWQKHYDIIFRMCCEYTHTSSAGFGSFIEPLPEGGIVYTTPTDLLTIVFPWAISNFLDILNNANEILSTDMSQDIRAIAQELW